MRYLILAVLLAVTACDPGPMPGTPAPSMFLPADAGPAACPVTACCTAPAPVAHRLKVGHYVTRDGLTTSALFVEWFYDTVLNVRCYPVKDATDQLRCFPDVSYTRRAFRDSNCHTEVFVAPLETPVGTLRGSQLGSSFSVGHVGDLWSGGTYWQINPDGACLPVDTSLSERIFGVADDITATLETLDLQWSDVP